MYPKDSNKTAHALALIFTMSLPLLAQPAMAMEALAGAPGTAENERPEEIVVSGQRSLIELNKQIRLAEDHMFALFNDLNDDDRYDVHCLRERRTGTKISQRVCRPMFIRNSTTLNGREFLADAQGMTAVRAAPAQAEFAYRYPILIEKMTTLTREHPELFEAVAKHYELSEEFRKRTSASPEE